MAESESRVETLRRSGMGESGVWGGHFEMCILAHLLHTPIYSLQGGYLVFLME